MLQTHCKLIDCNESSEYLRGNRAVTSRYLNWNWLPDNSKVNMHACMASAAASRGADLDPVSYAMQCVEQQCAGI